MAGLAAGRFNIRLAALSHEALVDLLATAMRLSPDTRQQADARLAEVANSTTAASVLQLPEVIETVLEHVELAACPASVGRAWSTEWTRKTRHVLRHAFLDHGILNVCGLVTVKRVAGRHQACGK